MTADTNHTSAANLVKGGSFFSCPVFVQNIGLAGGIDGNDDFKSITGINNQYPYLGLIQLLLGTDATQSIFWKPTWMAD